MTAGCDLFSCRHSILQAGMGCGARVELAAAVSRSGGFGCLRMAWEHPELIAAVRDRMDAPFRV